MNTLVGLTDQPKQTSTISLADGSRADITLEFKPQQNGWFYSVAWNGFSTSGQRLVASPNVLRQYINLVPFGLAVITKGNVDPSSVETFADGSANLVLLEGSDISGVETAIYGATPAPQQATATTSSGTQVVIPPTQWGPAGGDLSGSYPNPSVVGMRETSGPTELALGSVLNGQYFKRVGSTIVGDNPAGTGDVVGPAGATNLHLAIFDGVTGKLLKDGGAIPTALPPNGAASGDLGASFPSPTVTAIHETSGPTKLTIGAIADGEFAKRVGTTLVGATPSGTGDVVGPGSAVDSHVALFNGTTGKIIKDGGALGTAAFSPTSAFDGAGAATAAQAAAIAASLQKTSDLSDLASTSTARTNLGLGTAATQASSAFDAAGAAAAAQSAAQTYADTNKLAKSANFSDVASVPTARTNLGLGTSNSPSFSDVTVTGGIAGSIGQFDQLKINPELGYPSGGSITLGFNGKCNVYIPLTIGATFSTASLAAGVQMLLTLKNTTGGVLSLAWPSGWNWDESAPPSTINPGAYLTVRINSITTADSGVIASFVGSGNAGVANVFFFTDYGATGNGSTDDTTALQNCINAAASAHGCAVGPPGTYRITSALTLPGGFTGFVSLRGYGIRVTKIRQDGAANGLDFDYSAAADGGVQIQDLALIASVSNCGTALKLTASTSATYSFTSLVSQVEVNANGVNSTGWNSGFDFYGCANVVVDKCFAYGNASNYVNSSGAGGGFAIQFRYSVNCFISEFTALFWQVGINLPSVGGFGGAQGIVISQLITVELMVPIYSDNSTIYLNGFVLDNGNLNVAHQGIQINNTDTSVITNGQILQYNGANQIYVNNSSKVTITNVDFAHRNSVTGAAVLFTGGSVAGTVTGCTFSSLEVQCDAGTSKCKAYGNTNENSRNNSDAGDNHLGDSMSFNGVVTTPGGAPTSFTISVNITETGIGRFIGATSSNGSDDDYLVRPDFSAGTTTNCDLVFSLKSGGAIGSGQSIRWLLQVCP